MEDAILYAAAFDANGGVFEPLLTAKMPSFLMSLIMLLLLMVFAYVKQSAIDTKTAYARS